MQIACEIQMTEPAIDSTSPHRAALNKMITRYARAAVAPFTGTLRKHIQVIAAMIPATIVVGIANCMARPSQLA